MKMMCRQLCVEFRNGVPYQQEQIPLKINYCTIEHVKLKRITLNIK